MHVRHSVGHRCTHTASQPASRSTQTHTEAGRSHTRDAGTSVPPAVHKAGRWGPCGVLLSLSPAIHPTHPLSLSLGLCQCFAVCIRPLRLIYGLTTQGSCQPKDEVALANAASGQTGQTRTEDAIQTQPIIKGAPTHTAPSCQSRVLAQQWCSASTTSGERAPSMCGPSKDLLAPARATDAERTPLNTQDVTCTHQSARGKDPENRPTLSVPLSISSVNHVY
mmetsp:Transcript_21054/g.51311  ORF Transcript_21054/g.51311 Transcript_21054/m.51311 type:complete len:222 (-) Transcript_21054:513-1178(-)